MLGTITIVEQNAEFVVVNKPANCNFHDEGDIGEGLFNQVKKLVSCQDLYPVHRLDKITSGLIIFAKTLNCAQQFQQAFTQHQIEKYYLAVSEHKPKKKQGLISGDMEKSRRGAWKLVRSQNKPAITQFFSYHLGAGKRLFLLKPHTGKTHQIRVALNSIGAPILGDPLYNKSSVSDRGYLHAYALKFTLNQQSFQFIQPPSSGDEFISDAMQEQLSQLKLPWQLNWPKR